MILEITHLTQYNYSQHVSPGLHYFHFHPLQRPNLKTLFFELEIDPKPQGLSARLDPENNLYHQAWFSSQTDHLKIRASVRIESGEFNPFYFLVDDQEGLSSYRKQSAEFLKPYLEESSVVPEIAAFAEQFSDPEPIEFLGNLNTAISSGWNHHLRMEMNILAPEECFRKRAGSCRDLARLFMVMVRSKKYPARFVSGYAYVPGVEAGHELHAWVEVYLPGAGWIGFDPSLGLLATENYIPVAASFEPSRTMPVQGFYHGPATSELETKVVIRPVD